LEAPRTEIETSVPFHAIGSLNTLVSVHQFQDVVDMHGKRPSATIERHQPQFVMSSFVAKAQIPNASWYNTGTNQDPHLAPRPSR